MTFTKLPKAITAEELLSTPLPPVKWIIPGLLPAGLALFAGPSKAGKSWLTLVALLTDCAGQSCLESRNRAMHRDLFLVGRYI